MKKLIILLILSAFFTVSCSSSKKAENDVDILPDEDVVDADEKEDDENRCRQFANSDGRYLYYGNGAHCGCKDGYFWANPGCKKITYANICTGAAECYDNQMQISCPKTEEDFYGQDAQYARLELCIPQNFSTDDSVLNEPVVFDNNLKIEWMAGDSDYLYTWDGAVKYCENLEYAGHDDWRLPSPKELIVGITGENDIILWSSQQENDSDAWVVYSISKTLTVLNKINQKYVRCVRGEPIEAEVSFRSIDTNLVMDYQNGLMWNAANYIKEKTWNEALAECEKSIAGGFSDWRLPNINELSSMLNFEKSDPALDFTYPENMYLYFWSSTTQKNDFSYASAVNIDSLAAIKNIYKNAKNRVVCVRNEPCIEDYFWDGIKCVESPCNANPCQNAEHSDGVCNLSDSGSYSCGCVENYFWDGEKCVSPCDPNPCTVLEHTTGVCTPHDEVRYNCGCKEGFYWWGQNKGCHEKKPDLAHICTGQNKCYDDEKEIECPAKGEKFYGQDAQYADLGYCLPPSYTIERNVENEPVVIDNYTGLSWHQQVYYPGTIYWNQYKSYCETSNYGGYDDWRLPSILEYRSIMDFGRHHPNVDPKYFPDTPPEYFVTSDFTISYCGDIPYVTENREILMISFDHMATSYRSGWCELDPKIKAPARCVRGNKSFSERSMSELNVSENKSLYVDNKNSLLWVGAPGGKKWAEALDYCENLTFAGLSDWRLTNINESSLFVENLSNRDPAYSYYHSSTTEEYDPTRSVQDKLKIRGDYMLCVRDNPCETGELWDGTKCMKNPCADLPCKDIEHSDKKICTPVSEDVYSCSCNYYYYWNFNSLKCIESCKSQPCEGKSYSTKECFDDDFKGYSCGCVEGYSWDSASKRCVKDETPDEAPDTDTDEIPDEMPDSDNSENGE